MTDTQLTLILGFAGTIANQFYQYWRTEQSIRQRAVELKDTTAKMAAELRSATASATQKTHAKLDDLKDLQAENTRVTEAVGEKADAAYKEANDVNAKILSLKRDG